MHRFDEMGEAELELHEIKALKQVICGIDKLRKLAIEDFGELFPELQSRIQRGAENSPEFYVTNLEVARHDQMNYVEDCTHLLSFELEFWLEGVTVKTLRELSRIGLIEIYGVNEDRSFDIIYRTLCAVENVKEIKMKRLPDKGYDISFMAPSRRE
jgi:hypothetical protein